MLQQPIDQYFEFIKRQYRDGTKFLMTDYMYTVQIPAISTADPADLTVTRTIQVTANGDFCATELIYNDQAITQTTATVVVPVVEIQIQDSGTNENFFASPVSLENVASPGVGRRMFPYPRWVSGKSTLTVTARNYSVDYEGDVNSVGFDLSIRGILVRVYN